MSTSVSTELEVIVDFIGSSVDYLRGNYQDCTQQTLDDIIEIFENVLQYYVLLIDDEDDLFLSLRDLMVSLVDDRECRAIKRRGRPEIIIAEEQLQYLIEQGFGTKEIAEMFSCSRRTVERRIEGYGISHCKYATLSDSEIDALVHEITSLFPACGEKTKWSTKEPWHCCSTRKSERFFAKS